MLHPQPTAKPIKIRYAQPDSKSTVLSMTNPTPENPFPIVGAGVPGEPHPRSNINDFSTADEFLKQWNLYLQAMINLQKHSVPDPNNPAFSQDINRPLGFYQIAGIHGLPFINWVEYQQPDDRPGNYCTHGTSLFLTWHRPYLLLLEQCLVDEAVRVANAFHSDVKDDYISEARKIRLPYWDWATDSDIPKVLRYPKTNITLPSGDSAALVTESVDNPLYSYKFENSQQRSRDFAVLQEDTLSNFPETKRCPDAWGYSHPEIADRQLRGPINPNPRLPTDFRDGVFKLLTTVSDYGEFSNTGWAKEQPTPPPQGYQSLESYHNSVHNYTGTDFSNLNPNNQSEPKFLGHMSEVAVSGFDPLFWFHHANIDRLYALWQSIHYESEFKGQQAEINRLPAPPPLTHDSVETPLRPFYFEKNKPWTSKDVQKFGDSDPSVLDYNYYYPEMESAVTHPGDKERLRGEVLLAVTRLYGPKPEHFQYYNGEPVIGLDLDVTAKYRREWIVVLRVKKYLVKGNFIVFFFLGKPEVEPYKWVASPNLVGSFHTFKSKTEYCANCLSQEEVDAEMSGGVDLTNALYNKLQQNGSNISLEDPEKVKDWLAHHLEWRILKDDGKELNLGDIQGNSQSLEVGVESFKMAYIAGDAKGISREKLHKAFDKVGQVYGPHRYLKGTAPEDLRLPKTHVLISH